MWELKSRRLQVITHEEHENFKKLIKNMTKIINLGTSAFYELQTTKKAKISFDGFETAISKVFPKQAKKKINKR